MAAGANGRTDRRNANRRGLRQQLDQGDDQAANRDDQPAEADRQARFEDGDFGAEIGLRGDGYAARLRRRGAGHNRRCGIIRSPVRRGIAQREETRAKHRPRGGPRQNGARRA